MSTNRTKIKLTEAAALLQLSHRTLRRWNESGKLKAKQEPLSGQYYYYLSDILKIKHQLDAIRKAREDKKATEENLKKIKDTPLENII